MIVKLQKSKSKRKPLDNICTSTTPDRLNKPIKTTSSEGFFFFNHHTLYLEILKGCFNHTHKFVDPVEQLITICELLTRLRINLLRENSALLCCC